MALCAYCLVIETFSSGVLLLECSRIILTSKWTCRIAMVSMKSPVYSC